MSKPIMQKVRAVPKGYKQTEVGVTNSSGTNLDANGGPQGGGMDSRRIPEDWEVVLLDAVTSKVGSGKTPSGGSTVYVDSGRPFVRSQNIGWGNLKLDDLAFITDEVHNTFLSSEIQKNDVFLNITGASIGRSALTSHELVGGNVNQHVCIVRACSEKLSPRLLVYLLNSDLGQRQIDSYQAGGNREGLNFSQIKNMSFGIPLKIKEQTAIANALSDVDALISELEKLIAKKQAIKTATMQQLLTGKTRLPQFVTHPDGTKKGYKQTELGQVPEDWKVEELRELLQENIPKKSVKETQVIAFVGMQDVSESAKLISQSLIKYKDIKQGLTYFEKGDVLVAKITPCFENGKGCETNQLKAEVGFGSTEFHVLRASENADSGFIYYWTIQYQLRKKLESEMVGSAGHRRVPYLA